ncbi:glycoside hydrolase family 117 protein [Carboxylicivirga marina]|uniref:Family 43 glycosylhydrolase n=1 Tax=Carboxylicivirga marina TaxID=2800988 RepID=A0ABS1HIP6_9BACT|nr:family 43 glycosylhydrolase [Carboxylicivirga marina]MBK3517496.1 family 43 glycosylhydrolase [Carboxylicivirga marina]
MTYGKYVPVLWLVVLMIISACNSNCQKEDEENGLEKLSASMKRYKTQWEDKEPRENEFYTCFKYKALKGLEYEEGISRRDPSSVIKVDDKYYVYYTRSPKTEAPVGYKRATDKLPANTWDLCDIFYATSTDGKTWEEQGVAASRGPEGEFDDRSVFTPDIMVYKGKYYLYYQAVKTPYKQRTRNVIGMSWADSPEGPWHRHPSSVLEPGEMGEWEGEEDDRRKIKSYGAFDSHKVHDPNLIVRDGKIWMYYKAHPMGVQSKLKKPYPDFSMGVAMAETPEGPFEKHSLNPISASGHEALVWPYKEGVATIIIANGPEKNTVQWARDGVNFEVKAHVVLPPDAAGLFCPDKYDNTKNGKGFTWGLCHIAQRPDRPWAYLIGFECDLSSEVEKSQFKKENIRFDEYSRVNSNRAFVWKK